MSANILTLVLGALTLAVYPLIAKADGPPLRPEAAAADATATDATKEFTISDGTVIDIVDKGIALTPPKGWEVYRNYPSTTLLLQAPENPQLKYRRTIQVMSFAGSQFIDDLSAEKFGEVIVKKFARAADGMTEYKIRNYLPVKLESGVEGYLYYAGFKVEGVELMQMHILASSSSKHFLLTFTDLAEYFGDGKKDDDHLNEAWASMGTLRLDSTAPSRFSLPVAVAGGLVGFVLLIIGVRYVRGRAAHNEYSDYANGKYDEDDDLPREKKSPQTMYSSTPVTIITDDGDDESDSETEAVNSSHSSATPVTRNGKRAG